MVRKTTYFAKDVAAKDTEPTKLDVESLGDGRYAVTMDEHRFELDSLELSHGAVSMIVEGNSYAVEFDEWGDEVKVFLRGHVMKVDIVDERRMRLRQAGIGFGTEGRQTISAPMPGKVVKIFVKAGDEVPEGHGLVVVEAMKMENELKAPRAGKVTEVLVKEGMTVDNGAPLVIVE
jgi:biotin carboxyl carrier protein